MISVDPIREEQKIQTVKSYLKGKMYAIIPYLWLGSMWLCALPIY